MARANKPTKEEIDKLKLKTEDKKKNTAKPIQSLRTILTLVK